MRMERKGERVRAWSGRRGGIFSKRTAIKLPGPPQHSAQQKVIGAGGHAIHGITKEREGVMCGVKW